MTKADLETAPIARLGKISGKRKADCKISRPIAKMFDRISNQERSEGRNNWIQSKFGSTISKAERFILDQGI
jgi:hypothetical protein